MWKVLVCFIALFSSGKGICDGECKIDTCTSRTASIFVYKLISSGSKDGIFCRKDDSCVWIFQRSICQKFESLDSAAFKKSAKNYECYNMTKKEHLLVRRNAVVQLSKLRNSAGVIIFLPYFGMAIVLLLIIIWIHEEAEGLWTICKYRYIADRLERKKLCRKSATMIRYDDCDACIKTISSSLVATENNGNKNKNSGCVKQILPKMYRTKNLYELITDNRMKEVSHSSIKLVNSDEPGPQVTKFIVETRGINCKQTPLGINSFHQKSAAGVSTTFEGKCIESLSGSMVKSQETSESTLADSEDLLARNYCKECNLKMLKCNDKSLQKTVKVTEELICVKAVGEESEIGLVQGTLLDKKLSKVTEMESDSIPKLEECGGKQLGKKQGNRGDVRASK